LYLSFLSVSTSRSWCGPCQQIKPIYDNMTRQYPDVAFGKIDVDDNSDAAAGAEITVVPTFILNKDNREFKRFSGADPTQLNNAVMQLSEEK
jgi:thioredoxin 1